MFCYKSFCIRVTLNINCLECQIKYVWFFEIIITEIGFTFKLGADIINIIVLDMLQRFEIL